MKKPCPTISTLPRRKNCSLHTLAKRRKSKYSKGYRMKHIRVKYQKPTIKEKKVTISFFLTNVNFIDQFTLMGDVYAQSGGSSGPTGGITGCNLGTENSF